MDLKTFSIWRVAPAATHAGVIILAFGLLCVATPRSRPAQTPSSATSQTNTSATGANLVVVGSDVKEKTVRFGEELVVLATLKNQGTKPIRIPPDALLLRNERRSDGYGGSGSGLGEWPLIRTGIYANEEFTIQPGESLSMTGSSIDLGAFALGSMKAEFVIKTEDEDLLRELGKPERFTVSYYVAPSRLMISAWTARTAAERDQLRPQIRELLLLASKPEESPGFYLLLTLQHLGCYTLPLLESALKDPDPVVRAQAIRALPGAPAAPQALNSFLSQLNKEDEGQAWAASVERCVENYDLQERESIKLALAGLADNDARVRIAAIAVLTFRAMYESNMHRSFERARRPRESMDERTKQIYDSMGLVDPALPIVKKLATDADPGVRAEAQKFLSNFASQQGVASDVVAALADPDAKVRSQALEALKKSTEAPPLATIEKAFASTKGEVALGLIELIYEREDSELAAKLTPGFKDRSVAERLMILTAIAGHIDDAALNLTGLGLKDGDSTVRRAAMLRLLTFPTEKANSLIKANAAILSSDEIGIAVGKELRDRALFPFLTRGRGFVAENTFPSVQGTGPVVSPDGKWVAYVETGGGRPGGTGGLGRSNLLSLTHVVRSDGSLDRIVSDMFLVGWMSDSRRVASARDGFAAIVNLDGKVVTEFGEPIERPSGDSPHREVWSDGRIREQFGVRMPHSKAFQSRGDSEEEFRFDYGEDAAFSPDGKWFGPRQVKDQWRFIDPEGNKLEMKVPDGATPWGSQAIWSPDGAHVIVIPVVSSGSFGEDTSITPCKALVIDVRGPTEEAIIEVDQVWGMGGWNYRQGRWNPWSRDGKRLAFIRQGQVWTSDTDGNATQATFDASNKVFPTFSPDGTRIAYITWQFDGRAHYTRLGPTDIWVVDIKTGLAARVTRADSGRIEDLGWLDSGTLIYDRLAPDDRHSTLRTVSLR